MIGERGPGHVIGGRTKDEDNKDGWSGKNGRGQIRGVPSISLREFCIVHSVSDQTSFGRLLTGSESCF